MEALKIVPYIFLMLMVAGVIAGAAMITQAEFGEAMTQCYNSSYTVGESNTTFCYDYNATTGLNSVGPAGKDDLNLTDEYYGIMKSKEGMGDVAEQFPTVGIIAVMVVIISLIAGVFVYMKFFR